MTKQGGWGPTGFKDRLRALRQAAGLTQEGLSRLAGCHVMTITKLERGTQEPAWPLVLALAKALGVECTAFQADVEAPEKGGSHPRAKRRRGTKGKEGGMRTDKELTKIADKLEALGVFRHLPEGEVGKKLMEVLGDVKGEELPRLAEICGKRADLHFRRAEALRAEAARRRRFGKRKKG